ncbi:carbohydrate-binding protein [Anaerococcus nagyae]|uniref:carbohydrate-binding protein n=1 Tax=Anaerococcus nagyae TaxID=1755241 RepID=UPI00324DA0F1
MYKIQKQYFNGTNKTDVRLMQVEPYRDFVVSLKGDLREEDDDIVQDKAFNALFKEFNPSKAVEELEERVKAQEEASENLIKTFILSKDLSEEQKDNILDQYPEWVADRNYSVGDKVKRNGVVYEVIQSHRSQDDWQPESTNALYKQYFNLAIKNEDGTETEVVADFKQPTGAHDTYKKGDKVKFNGKIYRSKIDNNAYSPTDYAQGWEAVAK